MEIAAGAMQHFLVEVLNDGHCLKGQTANELVQNVRHYREPLQQTEHRG